MFCVVNGLEHLGLGKIIEYSGNTWAIEYFDSPLNLTHETHQVPKSRVNRKTLGKNTRIYFQHSSTNRWIVGRVLQDNNDGVEVRFTDKRDVFLGYDQVFVRCKKPISDPTDYLANFITETPQFSQARSNFLDSYIQQRGAAWGISSLLSSSIELEAHQINVVRRVLSDASQRYLLADEVGLGKTIEAGVIIRQAILDDPQNHRIVVVVPASLVQQWRQELISRFGLFDYLDDSLFVIEQSLNSNLRNAVSGANLLVIDEAHHIASATDSITSDLYDYISDSAKNIARVILLSATPVIRNENGFLRMLHLLDPVVYNLSDEKAFRSKIQHRQALAETVAMLDPQNVLYLDSVLEDLLSVLSGDKRLTELVHDLQSQLIGMPDEEDPQLCEAIRLVRAHLSETYRLNRRILRNRRKQVEGLTPDRNGSKKWNVTESQLSSLESSLESWRISASVAVNQLKPSDLKTFHEFYWEAVSALLIDPNRFKCVCLARLNALKDNKGRKTPSFNDEPVLLENIISAIDTDEWLDARLKTVSTGIQEILSTSAKIVVFCTTADISNRVYSHLHSCIGDTVIRHKIILGDVLENDSETDNDPALQFLTNPDVKIIVCDSSAEEGLNLQGGKKVIIHFDLPIEANRIEQRIGRVDRYGSGSSVKSICVLDQSSKYQNAWYNLLNDGLGVFSRSISSLQYLVEEEFDELRGKLFFGGIEAMLDLTTKLSGPEGSVAKELKLINQQDGLDELSPLSDADTENITDVDSDWRSIRQAAMYWIVDTLLFEQTLETNPSLQKATDPPFRLKYRTPGAGGPATLIPISGFLDDFLGVIDFKTKNSKSKTPLSYAHTAHRTTAVKRGLRLLRFGDEFVDAVKTFSDLDDRGRSYAMWRHHLSGLAVESPLMCFRFDFLIESNLVEVNKVLGDSPHKENQFAHSSIARRGDALFPPTLVRVWINEEGKELDSDFVEAYLSQPYKKEGTSAGTYLDTNLKLHRFLSLASAMPDIFENWDTRCNRMRDYANSILNKRPEFLNLKEQAIINAKLEDEVRYAQLKTRIQHLKGKEADSERTQLQFESSINDALYRGIHSPSIKVDVAGVVFLSNQPFSAIAIAEE